MNQGSRGSIPLLMGIVNVTPDSFSDGGRYLSTESAFLHALQLLEEGAEIIDIGGESTRPPGSTYGAGAAAIDEQEELDRVIPTIERLHRERPDALLSIDTMKPAVARAAVEAGARMINDVSAGRYDETIWDIAATHQVPYILMHGHDPAARETIEERVYVDPIAEVMTFLRERIELAHRAGVTSVIADVGIGFAKGARENIALLRQHRRFEELGVPMLVGASRKAFIGTLLGGAPPEERQYGTIAACAVAARNGASMVRVHDVKSVREFFVVWEALGG